MAEGLSAPSYDCWSLTGAITFYESPELIEDCHFSDNQRGDDLVNLFRSPFVIRDSVFERTIADALDIDFSDGEIHRLEIRKVGNDAIDTSGSRVEIHDVVIDQVDDKDLSFGEASNISLEDVSVRGARIGMTSEDLSEVRVARVSISNSEIGVAVYQKKPNTAPACWKPRN